MSEGMGAGILIGAIGMWAYQAWQEPIALKNATEQLEGAYALTKQFSGQVGLIHGFINNYEVCDIIRQRLENDGGFYGCVLESQVAANQ